MSKCGTKKYWRLKRAAEQYGYDYGCIVPGCCREPIIHHFIPRKKGGRDGIKNMIAICKFHEEPLHDAGVRYMLMRGLEEAGLPLELADANKRERRRMRRHFGIDVPIIDKGSL